MFSAGAGVFFAGAGVFFAGAGVFFAGAGAGGEKPGVCTALTCRTVVWQLWRLNVETLLKIHYPRRNFAVPVDRSHSIILLAL